jgi:hypothetical protein
MTTETARASDYIEITTAVTSMMKQVWKVSRVKLKRATTMFGGMQRERRLLYIFDTWETAVAYAEKQAADNKLSLTYKEDIKLPFNKE